MTVRSAVAEENAAPGLDDLSTATRALRVQGANAAPWLTSHGAPCPARIFSVQRSGRDDDRICVARVGSADVIVQGGSGSGALDALARCLDGSTEVFHVPMEAATFRLAGPPAEDVLRQTCAVPLATVPIDRVVYTRVAGVSCAVLPEEIAGRSAYRIWVDYSYAQALWRSLAEILRP